MPTTFTGDRHPFLNTYGANRIHSKEVPYNVHFQHTVYEGIPG